MLTVLGVSGVVVLTLMVIGLAVKVEAHFPGLPAGTSATLLWLVAAGSAAAGGWIVIDAGRTEIVETRCEISERTTEQVATDDGTKGVVAVGRVRWQANGRTYMLEEPTVLGSPVREGDRWRLAAAYPIGGEVDCYYRAHEPSVIRLKPARDWQRMLLGLGGTMVLAAVVLAIVGRRLWRRRRPRPSTIGTQGWLGAALAVVVASGLLLAKNGVGGIVGTVLAILGGAGFVAVAAVEVVTAERGFDRMRRRLRDAQSWDKPPPDPDESPTPTVSGWDPYADDQVTGLWKNCRVWVASTAAGVQVEVVLERWPAALRIDHAGALDEVGIMTGDEAFDDELALCAPDEVWRPRLTAPVRAYLVELIARRAGAISSDGRLSLRLADTEADDLPEVLDRAAELSRSLPVPTGDPLSAVLAAANAEPIAAVRRGHYEWLVAAGFDVPTVVRAAAADPDPDIVAWARSQLSPTP